MDTKPKQEGELTQQERYELNKKEREARKQKKTSSVSAARAWRWLGVAAVVTLGIWALVSFKGDKNQEDFVAVPLIDEVSASDRASGNPEAPVVLIEYSDFQCPACLSYEPIMQQLRTDYPEDLLFVYRNFPLRQIHKNAQKAAQAAEAAGKQDKFWEMHDMLFAQQNNWADENDAKETFTSFAASLELDTQKFQEDFDSDAVMNKVNADYSSGVKSKVNSTPSFFLNGVKIQNPRSLDEFKKVIDDAIAAKKQQ